MIVKKNNCCGFYGLILGLIGGIILALSGDSSFLIYLFSFIGILLLLIWLFSRK